MKPNLSLLLTVLCAVFLCVGCAKTPITNRTQFMMMTEGQENAMGAQTARQVKQTETLSRDRAEIERLKRVGQRIAKVANRPDYKWEFNVVEKKDENAFALPGGSVFVNSGMMDMVESDDELAVVVGHEIAHVLARHGGERLSVSMAAQLGGQVAATAIGIQNPAFSRLFLTAYGMGSRVGVILPFSRANELEADEIGLILMTQAGYNPEAAVGFWRKMGAKSKDNAPPPWLSTHPADEERIAAMERNMGYIKKRYTPPN